MEDRITREHDFEVLDITRSATGRTLIGRALWYNRPEVVTDDGGRTHYVEEWMPQVFARTIAERGNRIPLLGYHDNRRMPFGAVQQWPDADDALLFEAKVSRTVAGDELLELIADGAMTGVSVGARPINNRNVMYAGQRGVQRVEAKLLELSLCALGQLDGAEVLTVRADAPPTTTPRLDAALAFVESLDVSA